MATRLRRLIDVNSVGTTSDGKDETDNSTLFKAIYLYVEKNINLMKYFGVYTYTSQKANYKALQMVYAIVLLTYGFYTVAAHARNLRYEPRFDTMLFYKLLVCIFHLYLAVVILIPSLTL